jgi:HSP20 family protein
MVIDFSTFYDFPGGFQRLFEEFSRPLSISQRRGTYPPLNISEDQDTIHIDVSIPGVEMSELELNLTEKTLSLKGERRMEKGNYYRQERPGGFFQRIINLNVPIDRERAKARLVNGVLEVTLPKAEAVKPKTISIESA